VVGQQVAEVFCWCHRQARQHVLQVRPRLGTQALGYYRQLYELERTAKDFTDAGHLQMRQELAVPILEQFHKWLEAQRREVLPNAKCSGADTRK
jgi:hypothetical protein